MKTEPFNLEAVHLEMLAAAAARGSGRVAQRAASATARRIRKHEPAWYERLKRAAGRVEFRRECEGGKTETTATIDGRQIGTPYEGNAWPEDTLLVEMALMGIVR